ncbi:MAG: nucleotidyltransferase domain-containing protein [Gaiellaceae bacterium]
MTDLKADPEALAAQQLSALGRIGTLLDRAGLAYWLFGGWAVDFQVGAVTRPHDDVDVAVWLHDAPKLGTLLEADGWRHAPSDEDDGGTGYERGPVRLELTYLVTDERGRIFIPLRQGNVLWSKAPLGDTVLTLLDVRARVVELDLLAGGKSSPREDPGDAAKDGADHLVLSRVEQTEFRRPAPPER